MIITRSAIVTNGILSPHVAPNHSARPFPVVHGVTALGGNDKGVSKLFGVTNQEQML